MKYDFINQATRSQTHKERSFVHFWVCNHFWVVLIFRVPFTFHWHERRHCSWLFRLSTGNGVRGLLFSPDMDYSEEPSRLLPSKTRQNLLNEKRLWGHLTTVGLSHLTIVVGLLQNHKACVTTLYMIIKEPCRSSNLCLWNQKASFPCLIFTIFILPFFHSSSQPFLIEQPLGTKKIFLRKVVRSTQ